MPPGCPYSLSVLMTGDKTHTPLVPKKEQIHERHPLERFRFCPLCGNAAFSISSEKSKRCDACGFELFMNPSAAVVAFIMNERGELLLTVRGREPAKGTLDLPGGFSDIDESSEESVCREVLEETGLQISSVRFLFSIPNGYEYSGIVVPTLDMFYECQVKDTSRLVVDDDVEKCLWLRPEAVDPSDIGLDSVRSGFIRYRDSLRQQELQVKTRS